MAVNRQNNQATGFEDSPNMIPGQVETAQQIEPAPSSPLGKNWKAAGVMIAVLLFAACGWTYSNQDQIKQNLGYAPVGATPCSAEFADPPLPEEFLAEMGPVPGCPLNGTSGACCEQGQRSALQAALLKQRDPCCTDVIPAEEVEEMPEIALKSTLSNTPINGDESAQVSSETSAAVE